MSSILQKAKAYFDTKEVLYNKYDATCRLNRDGSMSIENTGRPNTPLFVHVGDIKEQVGYEETTTVPSNKVQTERIELEKENDRYIWSHIPESQSRRSPPDVTLYLTLDQLESLMDVEHALLKDNGSAYLLNATELVQDETANVYALEFSNVPHTEYRIKLQFEDYPNVRIHLNDCKEEYDLTSLPTPSTTVSLPSSRFTGLLTIDRTNKIILNQEDFMKTRNATTTSLTSAEYKLPASFFSTITLNNKYTDPLSEQVEELKQRTYEVGLYTETSICKTTKSVRLVDDSVSFTDEDMVDFATITLHLKHGSIYPSDGVDPSYTTRDYPHRSFMDVQKVDDTTYRIVNVDPQEEVTLHFGGLMEYNNSVIKVGPENLAGGTELCVEPDPRVCKKAITNKTDTQIAVTVGDPDEETSTNAIDPGETSTVSTRDDTLILKIRKSGSWENTYTEESTVLECVRYPYLEVTDDLLQT